MHEADRGLGSAPFGEVEAVDIADSVDRSVIDDACIDRGDNGLDIDSMGHRVAISVSRPSGYSADDQSLTDQRPTEAFHARPSAALLRALNCRAAKSARLTTHSETNTRLANATMDEKYEALLLVCLALEPLACTPSRAKHSVSRARACVRAMAMFCTPAPLATR